MFKKCERRRRRWTVEHGYTISSPCDPNGSGELKGELWTSDNNDRHQTWPILSREQKEKTFIFTHFFIILSVYK